MTGGNHHSTAPLSAAILRELNDTVLELNAPAKSEEAFFDCLVTRCRALIPHSNFFVAGTDRQMHRSTVYFGPWAELATGVTPAFQRHLADHPYFLRHCLSQTPVVDTISDHVSQRQWRSTGLFGEVFKESNTEDQLVASQSFNERLTINLVVNRDGWRFKKEECALLTLLLPHVVQAWRSRAMIRRLEAAADRRSERSPVGPVFQVVTDSDGGVIEASDESALQQLWERFREPRRDSGSQLPGIVRRWMQAALVRHFQGEESTLRGRLSTTVQAPDGKSYHLRLLPGSPHGLHVLVIERRETPEKMGGRKLESFGLSPRRAQVLYWVAEGKSNGEIAAILGITLSTVKNHLSAIYDLLLVENRHAAILAAWRMLRGDESDF